MVGQPDIYIGCSGWSYKGWKGFFYPDDLPVKEYFSYYTRFFKTVELNTTFYRFPTQKTVQAWYALAPKEFKYSLKSSRFITHIKRFKNVQEPLKRVYGLSDILAEKMGCFLFQFPASFHFTPENLERLIGQLDSVYKNVIEFRHPSWWDSYVFEAFESKNIRFCTVSGFDLPNNLVVINKQAYIRFHGDPAYSSLYSEKILSEWGQILKAASLEEAWIYFNNDRHAYAVQNALYLKGLL